MAHAHGSLVLAKYRSVYHTLAHCGAHFQSSQNHAGAAIEPHAQDESYTFDDTHLLCIDSHDAHVHFVERKLATSGSHERVRGILRAAEESAGAATEQMLSASTIGQLILIIFVMGVLTGIGEELLFRGSVQRLFSENGTNVHLAIWITAFIFSAVHMLFYGLVPRMLIGAFLGYLYVWSGSLWLPIMGHALNNSVAVLGYRYEEVLSKIEWYNETPSLVAIAVSCVATALLIYLSWRLASKGYNGKK